MKDWKIIKDWRCRDWIWLILMLTIIIVQIFITLFCNQVNVRNYFSFGASVASIVLAVVAIIYAFLQSSQSSWQNQETQRVLNEMYTKIVEVSLFKEEFSSLKNEINSQSDSIVENIVPEIKSQLGDIIHSASSGGEAGENEELVSKINLIMKKIEQLETQYWSRKNTDIRINPKHISYDMAVKRLLERNLTSNKYTVTCVKKAEKKSSE